eukprot:325393_1
MSKKSKKNYAANQTNKKKVKLRTSLDVYHRLIHDSTLPINRSNVLIGYTDNTYEDIQHLPLHEWTLIDKGGDIPMHHIVYFKYKDIILWDKRIRLDRLYGSGNTKKSQLLQQILTQKNYKDDNKYDNDEKSFQPQNSSNNKKFEYPPDGKIMANPRKEKCSDNTLTKKGIKMICYVYSFGIIGYKFKKINGELKPIYLIIQQQGNKEWAFPKGHYETGEHANGYDTAKRELEEETGIQFNDKNIQSVDWVNPYISQYQFRRRDKLLKKWTVLFATEFTFNTKPNIIRPDEISGIKWMSFEQFNQKNKHTEYKDIILQLNTKLIQKIKRENIIKVNEECKDEIQSITHTPIIQRKCAKELINQLDVVIDFLTAKLFDSDEAKEEKQERDYMIEKRLRKKRLQYLMKKQQKKLWNIYKTKYNYVSPKKIDKFTKTFSNELNEINTLAVNVLGMKIKYEDVHFVFNTIFSKRRPDIDHVIERTKKEWNKIFEKYPIDKDNYGVAFEYNDEKTWLPLLRKYGFVVIGNILSAEECDKTVDGMFEDFNKRNKKDLRIDLNDYKTWDNKYWPAPNRKFLSDCPAFHKQAFKNRFNKKIEYVFGKIFNTYKLNVTIDNWGLQRPLKTYNENNECIVNKKWQYSLKPHWDYSPWLFVQEMNKLKFDAGYQGIIALNDHNIETGCHRNLPGCVNFIAQWTKEHIYPYSDKVKYNMYDENNMTYLRKSERPKKNDPIVQYMQNIPMRKGDFVIWSWGSLHGNTENISDKWRFVQYVRMFPSECIHPNYAKHDRYAPQRILNNKRFKDILFSDSFYKNMDNFCRILHLTKREKCLLGIEKW